MGQVPIVPALSAVQIEFKAEMVLKEYCPEIWEKPAPVPVDRIFEFYIPEKCNIQTGYTHLQKYGINAEGYTNARQMISYVDENLSNDYSITGTRRFRSTTGHEIGHCILHVPLSGQWQQSTQLEGRGMKRERSDLRPFEDPEWQAWRFCYALCMPAKLVLQMIAAHGSGYHGVTLMMDRFNMNYKFVMARLKSLKINSAGGSQRNKRIRPIKLSLK